MKYQNDIDKMNTNRNLFLMSLPIFVELLLQLLVGNVDQMMVSRVSQPSVAAIVNANQIMNLVIIVLSMASTAVTVILSQYLGAQDEKNASRTCMVSIVLIGGVSLAATILVFAGHTPLYRAIHVPEEVFDEASLYLLIVGIASVRSVTETTAVPFSGADWLMVTMLAPAALMPASRLCSAPVSSRRVAMTVITSRPFSESKMQSLYL